MKQSRKDFIKQAHESACSDWKKNIEKEFPKLFKEDDLKIVGNWYKNPATGQAVFYVVNIIEDRCFCYGVNYSGEWRDECDFCFASGQNSILATDKEVEQVLIKEAKKRGFKQGIMFKSAHSGYKGPVLGYLLEEDGSLHSKGDCGCIFNSENGKWAEIIKETITKEQAEKELGKAILN
jgi:hypothetical protein